MKPYNLISTNKAEQLFLGIFNVNTGCFQVSDNNVTTNAFKVGQRENEVADLNAASVKTPLLLSNDQVSAINYEVHLLAGSGYVCLNSNKLFLKSCNII